MNSGGPEYVPFDLNKVGKYTEFVRESSRELVARFVGASESLHPYPSLPISAWLYYKLRLGQVSADFVSELFAKDALRSRFRCGSDITFSDDVTPVPKGDSLYNEAIKLIRSSWPEMALLIQSMDLRVSLPPQGETYESASDPLLFGQVYYNMEKRTAIDWARILVHEVAHHYLFILTAEWDVRGVRFAWDTSVHSSIKGIQRPLIGLLHGGYAQACMLELASRLYTNRARIDDTTHVGVEWIFRRYGAGYLQDCATLEEFQLTEAAPELKIAFSRSREAMSSCGWGRFGEAP